jgi:hypothetical protein
MFFAPALPHISLNFPQRLWSQSWVPNCRLKPYWYNRQIVYSNVSQTYLFSEPFCIWKITKYYHILVGVNKKCPESRYPKLKTCMVSQNWC